MNCINEWLVRSVTLGQGLYEAATAGGIGGRGGPGGGPGGLEPVGGGPGGGPPRPEPPGGGGGPAVQRVEVLAGDHLFQALEAGAVLIDQLAVVLGAQGEVRLFQDFGVLEEEGDQLFPLAGVPVVQKAVQLGQPEVAPGVLAGQRDQQEVVQGVRAG
eukprot:CAMPEP_0196662816 /NCGR_PEP_ID=MMETSP1086-20130531/50438_1 /TAXON_ID=77921 /ORGANISM="Cyanoptyche  gloeocystis , Strain SAG4.97" /LENGTH=157 /DNA_ID=CAMNT_0041998401 /DNA_START=757 /DNA_END=1227 /DNA_ORIENTATION=-